MFITNMVPLFSLGRLLITIGAQQLLEKMDVIRAVLAHSRGDWGTVDQFDWCMNDQALDNGSRIFSVYIDDKGNKFYVITEADRSTTTVLLPEEY